MGKLSLRFFLPVLLLGVLAPLSAMVFVEPAAGDLVRIGFLPAREFGWQAPQPPLVRRTSSASGAEATVLVIGDSFSGIGLWQDVALSGEKYATYGFGQICTDIGETLGKMKLGPKTVVIQMVERYFDDRFFGGCDKSRLEDAAPNALTSDPVQRDQSILHGNYGAKYVVGSLFYFLHPGEQHRPGHSGGVDVAPVENGCLLFSNRECAYGLFLGDDRLRTELPLAKHVSPVFDFLRQGGVERIIVVPIPNKTSVYLQSIQDAKRKDTYLEEFAKRNGIEVVLLNQRFFADRNRVKDLYLPDDTHLSARGMQVLGGYIRETFIK
jgi:hypothetical protein